MPKKSLQDWYNSNDITYSQKEIIKKFEVGDYYPECERRDFLKIYYWNDILERNIDKLTSNHNDDLVYQMNFFSTWWNNNLILFIEGKENNYWVKLIVYEMPYKKNGETKIYEVFKIFFCEWICPGTLYEAGQKAKSIERDLRSDNPILGVSETLHVSYYDDYNSWVFPIFYGSTYKSENVGRSELRGSEFYAAKNKPDDYFKPLDIAMVFDGKWVHACICLGWDKNKNEYKICHARSGNRVKIESWESFLELIAPIQNRIFRYHPVIAFKRTDEIIKHIANCVEGESMYYEKKGVFSTLLNNCEHFVNRCVLGLNFSELEEKKAEEKYGTKRERELNIAKHLNDTKRDLDSLVNNVPWSKVNDRNNRINEIKEYRRNSGYENFDVMRDGIKMDSCIEVQPPKYIFREIYNRRNN